MNLALFDFDGTITKRDSFFKFLIYFFGYKKFVIGIIKNLHILLLYKLNIISNSEAKEKITKYFFKNSDFNFFQKKADYFSLNLIDTFVKKKAIERLNYHKNKNDKIVIVSASFECYLKKWCEKNNFELIGTKLEIKNNKLTGKFLTKNCYGKEKVNRIKAKYNLNDFKEIYVYGDSRGDYEMLKLAKKRK